MLSKKIKFKNTSLLFFCGFARLEHGPRMWAIFLWLLVPSATWGVKLSDVCPLPFPSPNSPRLPSPPCRVALRYLLSCGLVPKPQCPGERKGWYGHALNYPCPSEHLLAEQPGWGWVSFGMSLHNPCIKEYKNNCSWKLESPLMGCGVLWPLW